MSVVIKYSDISVGSKEKFSVSQSDRLDVSNLALFKFDSIPKRYDIPLELNSMLLDGGSEFLPEEGLAEIGFITEQMSDENGDFLDPIVCEFYSDQLTTSVGLMLTFDTEKNIYPSHINVRWYNEDVLLEDADFYPSSAIYFCDKKVEYYNRFVITFYSLNLPKSRLRMNNVDYGLKVEFKGDELIYARSIQEIDPISTSVPINTFDFSINSKKNIDFSFQTKQPIELIFNGEKKATTFVKRAKRRSRSVWEIQSEDYIGLMDSVYYSGGIYQDENAFRLLQDIFRVAKVPYTISSEFEDVTVSGYIPYTTCREALMQVLFAIGGVADTSNSDKVNVFSINSEVSQNIEKNRIMQGQTFDDNTRVTAVELTSHAYLKSDDITTLYDASQSGAGENILVVFNQPIWSLEFDNGIEVVEVGTNYALVNIASDTAKIHGKKYIHTTTVHRKENPLVLLTDVENVVSVENATLVSSNNVDNLLNLCYNFLVKTERTNMKIFDGTKQKSTKVGDFISYETDYLGTKSGIIVKQSFSLSGGILVKDSVIR